MINPFSKLAVPFIALASVIAAAWMVYSKGVTYGRAKEQVQTLKEDKAINKQRAKEHEKAIKIMSDNSLRERDELLSRMQSKPD